MKRRRTEELIRAAQNGSYLWSSKDLHNAMLWFTYHHHIMTTHEKISSNLELQHLMETLLRSPGVLHKRQMSGKRRQHHEFKESSLLPSILSQWIEQSKRDNSFTGPSIDHLRSTLCHIAKERKFTGQLLENYEKYFLIRDNRQCEDHGDSAAKLASSGNRKLQPLHYFNIPMTIVKKAYGEKIYGHLMQIVTNEENSAYVGSQESNESYSEAEAYLQKITDLAKVDNNALEVLFFVAIQPIARQYPPGHNLIHIISSDEFDMEDFGVLERKGHQRLSTSILNVTSPTTVHRVHSSLLCLLGKFYFPYAKAFIECLMRSAIQNFSLAPKFAANQTAAYDFNQLNEFEKKQFIFHACIQRLNELQKASAGMQRLCRDICSNLQTSLQECDQDVDLLALSQIVSLLCIPVELDNI